MSFTGNLKTVAFPDLLQLFSSGKKTGTVTIVRGKIKKELVFKEGNIIYASAHDSEEDYLGTMLYRLGRITRNDLERAIHLHRTSGKRIGKTLVEMGVLTREELGFYLKQQTEELIYNLFGWKEGEFFFKEGQLPKGREGFVELNTMNIVMEGTRRIDEWDELQKTMPEDNQVLKLVDNLKSKTDEVTLSLDGFRVIALIDSKRTLREVLEVSPMGEFVTSRAIFNLLNAKLIEVTSARQVEETNPQEEESLLWLLLRVYATSFNTIRRMLEKKLGPENEKLQISLAGFNRGVWSCFCGVEHADFPAKFEVLKRTINKMPKEIRALKLISGLNQILEEHLSYVYSYLGVEVRKHVAADIKKEVALALGERREIDKKYDVGSELYRILREVKLTTAVL